MMTREKNLKFKRENSQDRGRDKRFISPPLQNRLEQMVLARVPLPNEPRKRKSWKGEEKLEGRCCLPPFQTQGLGEFRKGYWVIQNKEFGLTPKGRPKVRYAHELFYLLYQSLPITTEIKLRRICDTHGCLNPKHYIELDALEIDLLQYLPEDL
jgi:hypothetical protein